MMTTMMMRMRLSTLVSQVPAARVVLVQTAVLVMMTLRRTTVLKRKNLPQKRNSEVLKSRAKIGTSSRPRPFEMIKTRIMT